MKLIKINKPDKLSQLYSAIDSINGIIQSVEALNIQSEADADFLSEKINEVQKFYKQIESSRLESTRVHRENNTNNQ